MQRQTANEQHSTTHEAPRQPGTTESGTSTTPAGESYANPDEQATLVAGDGAHANARASEHADHARPAPEQDAGDATAQSSGPVAGDEARRAAR